MWDLSPEYISVVHGCGGKGLSMEPKRKFIIGVGNSVLVELGRWEI